MIIISSIILSQCYHDIINIKTQLRRLDILSISYDINTTTVLWDEYTLYDHATVNDTIALIAGTTCCPSKLVYMQFKLLYPLSFCQTASEEIR